MYGKNYNFAKYRCAARCNAPADIYQPIKTIQLIINN